MNEASQSEKTLRPVLFLDELFLHHTVLERKRTFLHDRLEYCSKAKDKIKLHKEVTEHRQSTPKFSLNAKGRPRTLTAQEVLSSPLVS